MYLPPSHSLDQPLNLTAFILPLRIGKNCLGYVAVVSLGR